MAINKTPIIGNNYVNLTGKIMRVWAVRYGDGFVDKVIVEYIDKIKLIVNIDDWSRLDLELVNTEFSDKVRNLSSAYFPREEP